MENKEYYTPNDFEDEVWIDIKGFEDLYQISNFGRIKRKPFILSVCNDKDNYPRVTLSDQKNDRKINGMLHRLLALHFIPNPENKATVNHIDGNKTNYNLNNLEWCSYSENTKHAHKLGLINQKGVKNPHSKLKEDDVYKIRDLFKLGFKTSKIRKEYYPHLHWNTINGIKRNRTWTHI